MPKARSAKQKAASRENLKKARAALVGRKAGYASKEKLSYDSWSSAGRGPIRMHMR